MVETLAATYTTHSSQVELVKEEISDQLGPNEILVDTKYSSLNPVDVKLKALSFLPTTKHTLKDFSGVVTKVGSSSAKRFAVGDQVCGFLAGLGSEYIGSVTKLNVVNNPVFKKPATWSLEEAGGAPLTFGTAFQMLQHGRITKDCSVLVMGGATSVGIFAIQLAKRYYGVQRVVATCSGKSAEYVKSFGADEIIDYKEPNVPGNLVMSASKQKFRVVVDAVGGYDALAVSDKILEPISEGSAYTSIMGDGSPSRTYAGFFVSFLKAAPWMAWRYLFGGYYGLRYRLMVVNAKGWPEQATSVVEQFKIKVPVDSVYPIQEINKAWERLNGLQARGKIILKF